MTAYMAALHRLASTITFGEYLDQTLRDRLVRWIRSESIQQNLLSDTNLDMSRAVKVARRMGAALKNGQISKSPELHLGKLEKA